MKKQEMLEKIRAFRPLCEQEERDKLLFEQAFSSHDDIFDRACLPCHMTASGWIVNGARSKVLMAYHNIYDSWSWLGGHADGEYDLLSVALREAKEESGVEDVKAVNGDILSIESLTVDGHVKKGIWVPSHLHLNVTYLLEADDSAPLRARESENKAVSWFTPEEALRASTEKWFVERVYGKLVKRVK